ncbi:hypothetical protein KO507_02865 [Gilvimarinus agarilyticus]|uniref:hypothetical protein n=1 Tax=unclassified Gilvimarinus TaxID=2642066 RepID=UPI001C08B0DF|nr:MULTISPECIES: hypothetical protein [unclassified Gilvimarinus]MBU2884701.1 hypothetical protein [Gilvimarinus agarilyticus]MDO6569809.1 hypothetical protein [Gilvimarinus sp. 2_MG-2023]MDO6747377.1 hypothetical protein [Gilvimarinus sp. 1_MG-2023]
MKHLPVKAFLLLLAVFSGSALACDEACKKAQAETEHGVNFAGYLDSEFCRTTRSDFLLQDYRSLEKYRTSQLPGGHKGGMNNIRKMLDQRKEWLVECDDYLRLTDQGRVFHDKTTTDKIFGAIDKVSEQLNELVYNGSKEVIVTNGLDIAQQDFDQMMQQLEQHRTVLQLRGQLVNR